MYSSLLFKQLKLEGLKERRERTLRGGQYDFSLESYEDIRDQNFLERDLPIERDPRKKKVEDSIRKNKYINSEGPPRK